MSWASVTQVPLEEIKGEEAYHASEGLDWFDRHCWIVSLYLIKKAEVSGRE